MSLPWLRLCEARKVLIKMYQSSFPPLGHKLAATQTPKEVDVRHQARSFAATSDSSRLFYLDQLFLPSQKHLEMSPHDYLNLYLLYTPNSPTRTTCQWFPVSGSCDNVNDNSKNRTASSSMHMFDISYKQNGKMWQPCTVVGLVVCSFFIVFKRHAWCIFWAASLEVTWSWGWGNGESYFVPGNSVSNWETAPTLISQTQE